MEKIIIISAVAILTSFLTFFTGFGVGTLLLPVFSIFFPIEIAVVLTAIVHFLNNVFKSFLIGKRASKPVLLRFGIPAIAGAFIGAELLFLLSEFRPLTEYQLFNAEYKIQPIKVLIGLLIIFFALFDLIPFLEKIRFRQKHLVPGGFASGFFGGLSGHQGALRSAFLIKTGLSKEAFIATGIIISLFVDVTRLSTYAFQIDFDILKNNILLLSAASGSAFAGAVIGKLLLKKVTLNLVRVIVSIAIVILGAALIMGII